MSNISIEWWKNERCEYSHNTSGKMTCLKIVLSSQGNGQIPLYCNIATLDCTWCDLSICTCRWNQYAMLQMVLERNIKQLSILKRLWNFGAAIKLITADLCCSLSFSILFSDINECVEYPHICHKIEKNSDCRNRRPGYECLCKSGFQPFYNNSVTSRVLANCTGKNLFFLKGGV